MANGKYGWIGEDITLDTADDLDVIWWTFKKDRPHGHVGVLWRDRDGSPAVTHSGSRGVGESQLIGKMLSEMSKVRHLTIGDKK